MECSQILPGAVSPGPCSVATGYYHDHPFIVYASGKDVVILDGTLRHLQTILGSSRGYSETAVNCVHCSETTGRIAAVWGNDVVIFQPEPRDEGGEDGGAPRVSSDFPGQWSVIFTQVLDFSPRSVSWNRDGTQLLVGGSQLSLWSYELPNHGPSSLGAETPTPSSPNKDNSEGVPSVECGELKEIWRCEVACPVIYLRFSPDGSFFASAGENDRLIKIWYRSFPFAGGLGTTQMFSFAYIAHPQTISGFVWRQTSTHMPRGYVPNVLLTYCKDNICRLWSHSVSSNDRRYCIRFFIVASIDPIADIPFRTTLPINDLPFAVHWLNNKSTAFTNKANKFHAGALLPISRYGSVMSFASSINEEMLQSWVCIDDRDQPAGHQSGGLVKGQSSPEGDPTNKASYSLSNFLSLHRDKPMPHPPSSPHQDTKVSLEQKRALAHLMDDWNSSPDLLLCIHPSLGSLMVWTVEGLDAPPNSSRLVHVSFSSCLPHIFPPHLAQSLRQEFLQFIIKEPDAVQSRTATAGGGTISDFSLPVPSIRLPGGSMGTMDNLTDGPKSKSESTLYLVSSHMNGSINTWSVELTTQSNNCTSIAGLIHCGGTGGHHCKVRSIQRHPWLPVVMSVSTVDGCSNHYGSKERVKSVSDSVASELIIWNADLPGPLEHKSRLNELSRMFSTDPTAFQYVTWVPPISVGGGIEGVFARCPSSGLFVANIGKELCLFQTSLYCVTKPSQSSFPPNHSSSSTDNPQSTELPADPSNHSVTITSQLGKEGVCKVGVIERDISGFEEVVGVHSFRMCSLVTSFDIKKSLDSKFCKDVVVVVLENKIHDRLLYRQSTSPISRGAKTILHMWRVTLCTKVTDQLTDSASFADAADPQMSTPQPVLYTAAVKKVYSSELPLSGGSHVIYSSPACDIASSLQLQLPTLSSPFLFTTACSDGAIQCWQFSLKSSVSEDPENRNNEKDACGCECDDDDEQYKFELYEVFGGPLSQAVSGNVVSSSLDCCVDETIRTLPTKSYIPSAISSAYPGRFAMAHSLTEPPAVPEPGSSGRSSRSSVVRNALDQHAVVTIWECESSGGLKWGCEATLFLSGISGLLPSNSDRPPMNVLMEWLPMENGAYLLATCHANTVSIYGMKLPLGVDEFTTAQQRGGFLPRTKQATLTRNKSQASWECLVQFPCSQLSLGLTISCFTYTGSNSLLMSIGSEMHLFSCWVREDQLFPLSSNQNQALLTRPASHMFHTTTPHTEAKSLDGETRLINLLDYAHAVNTPLPQYHPKILIELMNSGKLHSVKAILVNLVKYLLLYSQKETERGNYFEEGGFEAMYGNDDQEDRRSRRLLSVSSDGILRRSRKIKPKTIVESIPHLSLAKMRILGSSKDGLSENVEDINATENVEANEDDYDEELFRTSTVTDMDNFAYGFEEEVKSDVLFPDLEPCSDDFSPDLARKLSSILRYAQLANLTDLEQVRLLAIAETVANTKMSFSDQARSTDNSAYDGSVGFDLGTSAGSGYASSGLAHGVRGGEAMDDCGLRYLLALQNYITLSESLPDTVSTEKLPPSDFIWAFHSDAETELLSAIPCVQEDRLLWAELRNVGAGWWLRSHDKLKTLIERLAKAQFMEKQDPLNALLFYLAMKKQSLVKGLFRTIGDKKMTTFFSNDFQIARWKKAALKNAFALLGKQRFEEAAAFFLLAGKLWDAVEVCVSRLKDLQLAFVITRLYEEDHGPINQRLLKEYILGEPSDQTPTQLTLEPSPDPFLRSIACWLLQDYPAALDNLLLSQQLLGLERGDGGSDQAFNPAIFNFYFYLRTNPLLKRRAYGLQSTRSTFYQHQAHFTLTQTGQGATLSNVGDEPLTAAERTLLFSTAYFHLCHGCPLLALNVLSKLPKSCGLGSEVCTVCMSSEDGSRTSLAEGDAGSTSQLLTTKESRSMANMIQSGIIGSDFGFGGATAEGGTDDSDWSQPVSSNRFQDNEEDDFDWSKPISSNRFQDNEEDDFDWSKPVASSRFDNDEMELSPPNFGVDQEPEGDDETDVLFLEHSEAVKNKQKSTTLSTHGLFILSLAEQLQYNACLSIVTEELITIYIPACCQYLWSTKGKESLPLLPLPKSGKDSDQSLSSHYFENAFERTFLNLRALLVAWLREETKQVKEICGFEQPVEEEKEEIEELPSTIANSAPAGYDLLTTLMNYVSLHAATSPSLLTIHVELMHLMNTLLPWSTGVPPSLIQDSEVPTPGTAAPNCAVDPSQLPILTSSCLPARHLTNLALHLRLMSASVITTLSDHTYPPIATQCLPHVDKVFELCCALSNCMTVCLSPTRFTDFTISLATSGGSGANALKSADMTPTPSGMLVDPHRTARGSPYLSTGRRPVERVTADLSTPNTKPSKWPGVTNWPSTLTSDEGKDPTPLSLVLVECLVSVYLGLFSVAWSQHSINDIILLLKNAPSGDMWYETFGGGVDVSTEESTQRSTSRSRLLQSVQAMTRRFRTLTRSVSSDLQTAATVPDLFVPPKRTLLDCYLSVPTVKEHGQDNELAYSEGYLVYGNEDEEDGEDTETEDLEDSDDHMVVGRGGPLFRVGSIHSESDSTGGGTYGDPNSFAWCLMNLCISKLIMFAVRKVLLTAGVEVLELVTASPLLYSTLKLLEEWESIFARRLDSLGPAPEDLFGSGEEGEESVSFQVGPALTRHKFILEKGNSPFRGRSKQAKQAKQLWQYLVHKDEVLETFIHYLFKTKVQSTQSPSRSLSSLVEEDDGGSYDRSHDRPPVSTPECRVVYKENDSTVTSFCVNSCSRTNCSMIALAVPREVLEIEVPDTSLLDSLPEGDGGGVGSGGTPQRSKSLIFQKEDFVMVHSATAVPQRMIRPQSSAFLAPHGRHSIAPFTPTLTPITHSQTGQSSSMLLKRNTFGIKRMAPHPTLAYYLTGSIDGSVVMWEFGTPRPVSTQRAPGMGASVTMIRFTPEGNKYGVTDNSGKLSLWQGIHTTTRTPYHILHSGMKHLSDFLFLGSSSFIATCGDGVDNRNVFLWDTLLPTKTSIVKEFVCHEAGVVSLGYSRSKQRLFCGDRRGEVLIFDLKQMALLQSLTVHGSAVNRIAVDDIDGFFVTGSADGDIKVLDSGSFEELASYPGEHAKSRLFRQSEGGVTDMDILPGGKLYSCGADGSVKCRTITL